MFHNVMEMHVPYPSEEVEEFKFLLAGISFVLILLVMTGMVALIWSLQSSQLEDAVNKLNLTLRTILAGVCLAVVFLIFIKDMAAQASLTHVLPVIVNNVAVAFLFLGYILYLLFMGYFSFCNSPPTEEKEESEEGSESVLESSEESYENTGEENASENATGKAASRKERKNRNNNNTKVRSWLIKQKPNKKRKKQKKMNVFTKLYLSTKLFANLNVNQSNENEETEASPTKKKSKKSKNLVFFFIILLVEEFLIGFAIGLLLFAGLIPVCIAMVLVRACLMGMILGYAFVSNPRRNLIVTIILLTFVFCFPITFLMGAFTLTLEVYFFNLFFIGLAGGILIGESLAFLIALVYIESKLLSLYRTVYLTVGVVFIVFFTLGMYHFGLN